MIALLARLWSFLGFRGTFMVAFLTIGLGAGLFLGSDEFGIGIGELIRQNLLLAATYVLVVGTVLVTAFSYSRPSRSLAQEDVLPHLVRHEYCVVLRSFGDDARMLVPHERLGDGFVRMMSGFVDLNSTFEQVLGKLANQFSLPCVGIVDQRSLLAPPGIVFVRARDTEWQDVVRTLLTDAHTIVLVLGSRQAIREGFRWELETIAALGLADRTVLVLPPPDRNLTLYARARGHACAVLAILHGGTHDAGTFADPMPPTAIAAQVVPDTPYPRWWRSEWDRPRRRGRSGFRRVGDVTYTLALAEAIVGNHEGFTEACYDDPPEIRTEQSRAVRVAGPDAASEGMVLVPAGWRVALMSTAAAVLGTAVSVRGRARRFELWSAAAFGTFLAFLGAGGMREFLGAESSLPFVFMALTTFPIVCTGVRRLHDLDRTGWWMLLGAVPVLGLPVQVVLGFRRGHAGLTRFGPEETPDPEDNGFEISYLVLAGIAGIVLIVIHALTGW